MEFNISPFLLQFGDHFGIRYYSLMYLVSLAVVYWWMKKVGKYPKEKLADICLYGFLWVIIGGRIGYVLFYQPQWLIESPLQLLKIWEGGMSFHGGLIGAIGWLMYSIKKQGWNVWQFFDTISIPVLFGLGLGRVGNFLNGELWGKMTDLPWCFYVEGLEGCRHPSQLYQTISDWTVVALLIFFFFRSHKKGQISALFLMGYAVSRILNEVFWREPSWVYAGITAGTWLSIPMFIVGLILFLRFQSEEKNER